MVSSPASCSCLTQALPMLPAPLSGQHSPSLSWAHQPLTAHSFRFFCTGSSVCRVGQRPSSHHLASGMGGAWPFRTEPRTQALMYHKPHHTHTHAHAHTGTHSLEGRRPTQNILQMAPVEARGPLAYSYITWGSAWVTWPCGHPPQCPRSFSKVF